MVLLLFDVVLVICESSVFVCLLVLRVVLVLQSS